MSNLYFKFENRQNEIDDSFYSTAKGQRCTIIIWYISGLIYNGLPVYIICERVNRYTVNFSNMLTLTVTYGKMVLDRKGCGRR